MDVGAFNIATEGFITEVGVDTPPVMLELTGHDIEMLFVEDN